MSNLAFLLATLERPTAPQVGHITGRGLDRPKLLKELHWQWDEDTDEGRPPPLTKHSIK